MDDLNRRMQDAQRARGRAHQAALEAQHAPPPDEGSGPLTLREGGYELCGQVLRDGDGVEVFVHGAGWVSGRFRWDGRPGSPPTLRLPLASPADPSAPTSEAVLALPEGAACRPRA